MIPRKQNHAAGQRLLDAVDIVCRQASSNHTWHDQSKCTYSNLSNLITTCHTTHDFYMITKATAL